MDEDDQHEDGKPGGASSSADKSDAEPSEIRNLTQLLDRVRKAAGEREQVSLEHILAHLGARSFGPLLLLAGVITLAPLIGDIPGVPTLLALVVLLVASQLVIGRDHMWLPRWLLHRAIARDKVERSVAWLRRPARFVDRMLRPRLVLLTSGPGARAIAVACIVIALAMPPMELVPFSANGAGVALCAFGLGLIARDGLLALLAFITTFGTLGAVAYGLL